jgi:HK97 family phage portal protein
MKIGKWNLNLTKAVNKIEAPFGLVWQKNGFVLQNTDTEKLLNDGYGANSTVYGMIKTMHDKFASIPWILYKVKNQQKAKQYKVLSSGYNEKALMRSLNIKASAFDEVDNDEHELIKIWDKPNAYQTGQQFREQLILFMKATGAAPVYSNKGLSGTKPLSLHSLPSQFIRLQPDPSLQTFDKVFYTITGEQIEIPVDQFLYWRYANPFYTHTGEHIYGLSPLRAGARVLKADNENMDAMAFTFANKGATGVFVPRDAAAAQQAAANKDDIRRIVDDRTNGRDYGKARTYINQPMDLITFGMTAVEMESINAHIQNKENLANLYNFPVLLTQMAKGTDSRYTDAIKYLVTNTLYPDLTGMRDWLNEWLIPAFGYAEGEYYFDFDITALPELQEDMDKMANIAVSLVGKGIINRNEARAVLKYDEAPDEAMKKFTVDGTVTPLEAVFDAMTDIDPEIM